MKANERADEGRVALSGRHSRVGSNNTVDDFGITTRIGMFTKQTIATVGSRFKSTSPL